MLFQDQSQRVKPITQLCNHAVIPTAAINLQKTFEGTTGCRGLILQQPVVPSRVSIADVSFANSLIGQLRRKRPLRPNFPHPLGWQQGLLVETGLF